MPSLLLGLPTNAKTSSDYMEGLFDLDLDSAGKRVAGGNVNGAASARKRSHGKNFSPSALKNRMEVLQNENKK